MLIRPLTALTAFAGQPWTFAGQPSDGIMKPLAADVKSGLVDEKTLAEVPAMS
jgi:hypothetical protein